MSNRRSRWIFRGFAAVLAVVASIGVRAAQQPRSVPPAAAQDPAQSSASSDAPYRALVSTYCLSCHNSKMKAGSLELDAIKTRTS